MTRELRKWLLVLHTQVSRLRAGGLESHVLLVTGSARRRGERNGREGEREDVGEAHDARHRKRLRWKVADLC